jgi:hypothetical protein
MSAEPVKNMAASAEEGRHACVAPTKNRGMPVDSYLRLQEVTGGCWAKPFRKAPLAGV